MKCDVGGQFGADGAEQGAATPDAGAEFLIDLLKGEAIRWRLPDAAKHRDPKTAPNQEPPAAA